MIRNNLSWINLNAGSSGGSGGGGVSDYNDLANRPIISMTGTSQNPLKLWNLSTGLYLLNGYVYYNTTNTRECVNLFVSITAQIQNGKYVLSAFVPSWEGHYEYIKANSTSTDYTDTQILKMLTEDDVLTLTNEVEYTPTTDYHPSTKKYVDEAMQSVMEEFAKMGVNEQDIKTLIAENRRRDIAIQALLNETADKNVTIEEDTHTISLDYSMEDGMATVNSIEGSTLVNVSKTVDEVYITKSQDRVEQLKVANTVGEQNGKICPIIEGDTLVNVCDQKDPIAITKSYTVENSGNHIALQGEYDGKCRPVIQGNTMVNLCKEENYHIYSGTTVSDYTVGLRVASATIANYDGIWTYGAINIKRDMFKPNTYYTIVFGEVVGFGVARFSAGDATVIASQYDSTITNNKCVLLTNDYINNEGVILYTYGIPTDYTGELLIKDIMIFEGDLTQTPELIPTEYVEGLKSSFEDNLVTQAMVDSGEESAENLGKYKVEYKVTGKNLVDREWKLSQGVYNDNGELIDDDTSTYFVNYIKIKADTSYTVNHIQRVYFYDDNFEWISRTDNLNAKAVTLDIPFNCKYVRIQIFKEWLTMGMYPQLEEGTQATDYEPYKEYTKTFYLNSPLLEGDTIEDINGVATHVKRYGKVVLDGSESSWQLDPASSTDSTLRFYMNNSGQKDGRAIIICSTFNLKKNYTLVNNDTEGIFGSQNGSSLFIDISKSKLSTASVNGFKQWLSENPTTVVYQLASPIYEPISTESILCDSYVNGHLDFDSAVPIEKVVFKLVDDILNNYLLPSTLYTLKFDSDNSGVIGVLYLGGRTVQNNILVKKGVNTISFTLPNTLYNNKLHFDGIGFNASNIVVTEAADKEFDYFNGVQSTFEENLVTDENNPHYGKYRVIYRTKSSDGNASTVKSVYLNSPLLQGDKLVVVNGKLCHWHKMGKVVLDGSESWTKSGTPGTTTCRFYIYINNIKLVNNNWESGVVKYSDKFKTDISCESSMTNNIEAVSSTKDSDICINIKSIDNIDGFKQWLQANPTTVVYELETPYYEEISSNPKDTVVDFYANGALEVQSAVYPLSMEFTSFEEELTYLYASTVYTVQFEANGNAIANITLGGATATNQEITHGLNRIQVTTPSTLVDNKLIIDGCGDCKISKVVVTNSTEEFEYFEGMKSAFEDKQNEDGTYTVEIVVYNAPIRLNKDKE